MNKYENIERNQYLLNIHFSLSTADILSANRIQLRYPVCIHGRQETPDHWIDSVEYYLQQQISNIR